MCHVMGAWFTCTKDVEMSLTLTLAEARSGLGRSRDAGMVRKMVFGGLARAASYQAVAA